LAVFGYLSATFIGRFFMENIEQGNYIFHNPPWADIKKKLLLAKP